MKGDPANSAETCRGRRCVEIKSRAPFIVPLFIPQRGCPHQCVFCNQQAITGTPRQRLTLPEAQKGIDAFLGYRRDPGRFTEIAFFGGNFLGLKRTELEDYLDLAAGYVTRGAVQGIRFSTRPDTIREARLDLLKTFPVTTVELGAQSMDNQILTRVRRGHRAEDTQAAVRRLRAQGYRVGLQLMVGLPGETRNGSLQGAQRLADLKPDFVRIYPTLVLRGSPLAEWYQRGEFQPLSLADAVAWVKPLYRLFKRQHIPVIRMGLPASRELTPENDLLAGPHHPAFGELVRTALFYDRAEQLLHHYQRPRTHIVFRLNPRSESQFRGIASRNLAGLQKQYGIGQIRIMKDPDLARDALMLESSPIPPILPVPE
ncbi:MAG: radical SAM protein [Desulfobacterales bacterium]